MIKKKCPIASAIMRESSYFIMKEREVFRGWTPTTEIMLANTALCWQNILISPCQAFLQDTVPEEKKHCLVNELATSRHKYAKQNGLFRKWLIEACSPLRSTFLTFPCPFSPHPPGTLPLLSSFLSSKSHTFASVTCFLSLHSPAGSFLLPW